MPIDFQCECGKPYWTADANAGRRMLCTRCGRELGVPRPGEEVVFIDEPRISPATISGMVLRGIFRVSLVEWLVCLAIVGVLVALMIPAVATNCGEGSRRVQCINNLKMIGLAFHSYHSEAGHFPANMTDARGKTLLSWRVAILPYIEQEELYRQFKLDEPWDSPNNWPLIAKLPNAYICSTNKRSYDGKADYQVVVGPGSLYDGEKPPSIGDVTDEPRTTFCVVESRFPVPWTRPDDVDIRSILTDLGSEHPGGYQVLMVDGSVKTLPNNVTPVLVRACATKAGGEKVDDQR